MARPNKAGLDYFELDCHLDEKVRLIQAEFGLKGFAVVYQINVDGNKVNDYSNSQSRVEKSKEENNNTLCKAEALALFEQKLWPLYPVKKGKGQVSLAAKQRLLKVGYEEMVRAIDRYKAELERDSDWRRPQNEIGRAHV